MNDLTDLLLSDGRKEDIVEKPFGHIKERLSIVPYPVVAVSY